MLKNRKLAAHEQAMEILNNLAASFHIVTISRIKGVLKEELLRQALDITQSRHPFLNARIVEKSNRFWFEAGTDKIPLSVVNKQHIQQWEEVVVEELNHKINSDKNLLRVTLINFGDDENTCFLITSIHHAIADGLSCIQLHSEILTNCQKITEGKTETNVTELTQLPSLDKLIPKSLQGFTGKISNIVYILRLKSKINRYKLTTLNIEKSVPIESRSCGMVHKRLDSELTMRLVDICRLQKTSVQAALSAAMLFAVNKKTNTYQTQNNYFSFRSAINLRSCLQPQISNEHLGSISANILSFHSLEKNTNFWDLARDIKQELEIGLASNDKFRFIFMLKKILESFLKNPYESSTSAALTNIGRVNIPQKYNQLDLEEISFVPSTAAFGAFFGAAVSTFREKMLLNFMFSQPSVSTETIETLASDMICIISDVCNQEK